MLLKNGYRGGLKGCRVGWLRLGHWTCCHVWVDPRTILTISKHYGRIREVRSLATKE